MTERSPAFKPSRVVNLDCGGAAELNGLTDPGSGDWKFVVVDTPDTRCLVLGPVTKYKYHSLLVGRFCELREFPCHTVKKPDRIEILDKKVRVKGGGRVRFDKGLKTLVFFDSSQAYGSCSETELKDLLRAIPQFSAVSVRIVAS